MNKQTTQFLKIIFSGLVCTSLALYSCKGKKDASQPAEPSAQDTATSPSVASKNAQPKDSFDINKIPVSDSPLSEFPFFSLPKGLAEQNKPIRRSFDRLFVPFNGIMLPVEGKVWKSYVVLAEDNKESWSQPYFEKALNDSIKKLGGVKIFDGKVSQTELDRIKEQATYFGEEGSIDYWNDAVKVYVVHRADKQNIYFQFSGNTASGQLQVIQQAASQ